MIITILITFAMISILMPIGSASGYMDSGTRGVNGWTDVLEGDSSFFIDSDHDMIVSYDDSEETLTFGESYDPYYDLAPQIRKAVDRAPQWLNDTLVWSFINLYSYYRMEFAEVLLNESIDYRYMDEIAFTLAYMPSTFMNYNKVEGKYLWENVHMMYTVSDDVKYASISDYNQSDGQHSTITYRTPTGNVTMPEEIYYWYVVMPKMGHDNLEYMDPETGDFAYSYEGGEFWRTWLYYNNHTGYPLLKEYLAKEDYMWNGTRNQVENNGAVGAVTKWEMESVMFGMPQPRKSNPIYIYMNHMGMCGENSYILAAVAKIALIPNVATVTWEGDHQWNDFWERGWHQWEGYSGLIDDPSSEGPYGGITAFTSLNPDFSHFSLTGGYTCTSNLTVRVRDLEGTPVDGVMVKLHSYPSQNIDGSLSLIANLTDVNGETTFEIGTGFSYFVNYRAPIGGPPDTNAPAIFACTTSVIGADYEFNLTLPDRMPLKVNYSKTEEAAYGLRFNLTADDIDHLTNFYEDDMNFNVKIWKGYEDITRLSVLFLDDDNLQLYKQGRKFYPGGVLNLTEGIKGSIILENQKWNILVSGMSAPLTRTFASLNISVEKSLTTPEARIISPEWGSVFKVGEMVHFEGILDFLMDSYDDYSFKWILRDNLSVISKDRIFSMPLEAEDHIIDLEVWRNGEVVSTSMVRFNVYQPNRPPTAVIASPIYNGEYAFENAVEFSAEGSSDPDEDTLTFEWKLMENDQILSEKMEFSAKFETGVHWVELSVSDGKGLLAIEQVRFIILDPVHPPVPMITSPSPGLTVFEDEWIELDASGTIDPDEDDLDYKWISSLDGIISRYMVDSVHISIGDHLIELQVSDDDFTRSLFVNVTVMEKIEIIDLAPVSIILSPNERVEYYVSDQIEFDASASYDPDGTSDLAFQWRVDGEILSREMTFSTSLREGDHQIKLTVKSGGLVSNSSLNITVIDRVPIMKVSVNGTIWFDGEAINVTSTEKITFDGSGCEDPDGSDLYHFWSINGAVINDSELFVHTFEPGVYLVQLSVVDEGGKVSTHSLHVTSTKRVEPNIEEPEVKDESDKGKGIFQSLWLIAPLFGLVMILILLIFQFVRNRKNREDDLEDISE
jgi:hypothetical protein